MKNDCQKHQYSKANPHGKMTVKQLAAKDKGLQSIEVTDQNIGSFNRIARKYGIDFAPFKVKGEKRYICRHYQGSGKVSRLPLRLGRQQSSTSFDCSGFVSWVINHSGWDVGRLGAQGLCNICTPVSSANVKPGDLVFFTGTYDTPGVSHVGIYVGNNMMITVATRSLMRT